MSLRPEADDKNKDAPRPVAASDGAIDDDIVVSIAVDCRFS